MATPAEVHDHLVAQGTKPEHIEEAFDKIVQGHGEGHGITGHAPAHTASKHPWLQKLVPGIERYAASYHMGNYIAVTRGPNPQKEFEAMPIYARLGMHLLFYNLANHLSHARIQAIFKEQSIKQGKAFDSTTDALQKIEGFVRDYSLEDTLDQLVKPNLKDYKTFNEFFSRDLRPDARPVDGLDDPNVVVSAADCRLTVFENVSAAKQLWIKDHSFSVETLLDDEAIVKQIGDEPSVAIFRLAPADYHRWHSPVEGTLGPIKQLPGQYYTVNPQAVNLDLRVFTGNRRDVTTVSWPSPDSSAPPTPVAVVAVGALLVGAITWVQKEGTSVKKGQQQGYFYGGSTVIVLFPKGAIKFDQDLLDNSAAQLETKVAVGNHIGARAQPAATGAHI